jgi:leader peptidase (prepilin peptidase)/N-methyltransferase
MAYVAFSLALSLIDIRSFRLPHRMTLPMAGLGFLFSFIPGNGISPWESFLGFVAGIVPLGILAWKKQETFGFGDAVFAGAIGTYVGVAGLGLALFAGGGLAVIFGLGKDRGPMAFGPYLAFGGVCSLIVLAFVPRGFGKMLF